MNASGNMKMRWYQHSRQGCGSPSANSTAGSMPAGSAWIAVIVVSAAAQLEWQVATHIEAAVVGDRIVNTHAVFGPMVRGWRSLRSLDVATARNDRCCRKLQRQDCEHQQDQNSADAEVLGGGQLTQPVYGPSRAPMTQ
jgi:hypothetical protein